MDAVQTRVRLVRTEIGQTLAIPREFELAADEAVLSIDGDRLVLEPVRPASLLRILDGLEALDEPWPEIEDPRPEAIRL